MKIIGFGEDVSLVSPFDPDEIPTTKQRELDAVEKVSRTLAVWQKCRLLPQASRISENNLPPRLRSLFNLL